MEKTLLLILCFLLPLGAQASDEKRESAVINYEKQNEQKNYGRYGTLGINESVKLLGGINVINHLWGAIGYRWDWFRIEGEINWLYGWKYQDQQLAALCNVYLGWFFLSGGISIPLYGGKATRSDHGFFAFDSGFGVPVIATGLNIPLAQFGPLTMNIRPQMYLLLVSSFEYRKRKDNENPIISIIEIIAVDPILGAFTFVLVPSLGLNFTLPF